MRNNQHHQIYFKLAQETVQLQAHKITQPTLIVGKWNLTT